MWRDGLVQIKHKIRLTKEVHSKWPSLDFEWVLGTVFPQFSNYTWGLSAPGGVVYMGVNEQDRFYTLLV